MDFIPNHSSDKHEWFLASKNNSEKYRDYYVWHPSKDSTKPPNNWVNLKKFFIKFYCYLKYENIINFFVDKRFLFLVDLHGLLTKEGVNGIYISFYQSNLI